MTTTRTAGSLLALLCALAVTACSANTNATANAPDQSAQQTSTQQASTTAPVTSTQRLPATPPPPYEVTVPERTRKTAQGFPVNTCVPDRFDPQVLSLTTSDGFHLPAIELGSGDRGILLDHESGYYICSWLGTAEKLAAKGYHVMVFEYRGHGAAQKNNGSITGNFDTDTSAALAELHRCGAKSMLLGGASCGGSSAARLAAKEPQLVGLLILSSPSNCGGDSVAAIRKVTKPAFFAVEPDDYSGNMIGEVKKLYEASGAPAADKHLEILPGGTHGTDMLRDPKTKDQVEKLIFDFVDSCFRRA
ncbi:MULTISPECIES: alpha/beta hydrolase [unclassified Amycolatopsis]|uniref:alpha/beta hydrolase n=1 Tax=unclassified Amycolatopsis TaxID=2618356 RepID=UPI001C698E52|nr:alpha/beta hydrolase [Amycolatopsis sp. DSM 110486]QYN23906.1 alpha/beta hydrolase [Amycolatopsis sp. DSM 110486]